MYWFLFKIDDLDDANILDSLMDQFPPPNILVYSTEEIIGLSPEHVVKCCQSFTQVTSDLILKYIRFSKYYSNSKKYINVHKYDLLSLILDLAWKNSSFIKRSIKRMSETFVIYIFQVTKTKTLYHLFTWL